jgi:hypothetical protein
MRLVFLMFITDSDLSLYQTAGIRIPIQNFRDFHWFTAVSSQVVCYVCISRKYHLQRF